jgi:hypothetical protein
LTVVNKGDGKVAQCGLLAAALFADEKHQALLAQGLYVTKVQTRVLLLNCLQHFCGEGRSKNNDKKNFPVF